MIRYFITASWIPHYCSVILCFMVWKTDSRIDMKMIAIRQRRMVERVLEMLMIYVMSILLVRVKNRCSCLFRVNN